MSVLLSSIEVAILVAVLMIPTIAIARRLLLRRRPGHLLVLAWLTLASRTAAVILDQDRVVSSILNITASLLLIVSANKMVSQKLSNQEDSGIEDTTR